MRIYITGSTGYLGMNLICALLSLKEVDELRLLVQNDEKKIDLIESIKEKYSENIIEHINDKITFQVGSLPYARIDLTSIDCLIHAAALRGLEDCKANLKNTIDINIIGTKKIVDAVIKARCAKTIFISSQFVYFGNPELPWKETSELTPMEIYSATKYAGEILIRELEEKNLLYSIVRASRIYGLGSKMRKEELLSKFTYNLLNKKPFEIYGDGYSIMDFVHIKDIVNFLIMMMKSDEEIKWNQVYNVGGGMPVSLLELIDIYELIGDELGLPINKKFIDINGKGNIYLKLDVTKAKEVLGWEPKISLYDGIREIVMNEANI